MASEQGAGMIGHRDAGQYYTGITTESVLQEIGAKLRRLNKAYSLQLSTGESHYIIDNSIVELDTNNLLQLNLLATGSNYGINRQYFIGLGRWNVNSFAKLSNEYLVGSQSTDFPVEIEGENGTTKRLKVPNNTSGAKTIFLSTNVHIAGY